MNIRTAIIPSIVLFLFQGTAIHSSIYHGTYGIIFYHINEKVKSQGKFSQYSYISATGFVAEI